VRAEWRPSRRRWRCLAPRRRRTYHGAPMPAPHAYDALEAYAAMSRHGNGTISCDNGVATRVDVERRVATWRDASRPLFAGGGGTRGGLPFGRISNDATGKQTKAVPVHYQTPQPWRQLHPAPPLPSSLALGRSRWPHSPPRASSWTPRARRSSPSGSAACAAACTSTRSSPSRSTAPARSYAPSSTRSASRTPGPSRQTCGGAGVRAPGGHGRAPHPGNFVPLHQLNSELDRSQRLTDAISAYDDVGSNLLVLAVARDCKL
jgi:hypothetical protein